MLQKVKIEAVNGINVRADGMSLVCIGNKPVRVGDYVWTDGRCVFGFERSPSNPFVLTPKEDLIVPIATCGTNLVLHHLDKNSNFKKINSQFPDLRFSLPSSDTPYYLTVGLKDSKQTFALVKAPQGKYNNHWGRNRFVDSSFDNDGNLFCFMSNGQVWRNSELVFDFNDAIHSQFVGYDHFDSNGDPVDEDGVVDYGDDNWWAARDFERDWFCNQSIDRDGNFHAIARVHFHRGTGKYTHEVAGVYWGNTFDEGYSFFYIHNQIATLLYSYTASVEYVAVDWDGHPNHEPNVVSKVLSRTIDQPFVPHSVFFPIKNEGHGGWFSFDFSIGDPEHIGYNYFILKSVKFYDADRNELFSLSRSDFLNFAGFDLYMLLEGMPNFDFCKLQSNEYLLLITVYPNSEYRKPFLYRYKNGQLSLLTDNFLSSTLAISTTNKKTWRAACSSFDELLPSLPYVIFY